MQAAEAAACRALLRLARAGDRQPSRLVGLLRLPAKRFDCVSGRPVRLVPPHSPFLEDVVWEAGGGSLEFAHPAQAGDAAAARAVRRHIRRAKVFGFPYVGGVTQLARRFSEAGAFAEATHGIADAAQPDEGADATGRADISAGAGPAPSRFPPSSEEGFAVGDVLISHPLSCLFDPSFDTSVVLVTEVTHSMVEGFVLNKPTKACFDVLHKSLPVRCTSSGDGIAGRHDMDWGPLRHERVFRGGPVIDSALDNSVFYLHCYGAEVPGARRVAEGVWIGGDLAVLAEQVREKKHGVTVYLGCSAWRPHQLKIELGNGVWVRMRPGPASTFASKLMSDRAEGSAAWRQAMRSSGMQVLAEFPRGPNVDRHLHQYLNRYVDMFFRDPDQEDGAAMAAGARGSQSPAASATSAGGARAGRGAGRRSRG